MPYLEIAYLWNLQVRVNLLGKNIYVPVGYKDVEIAFIPYKVVLANSIEAEFTAENGQLYAKQAARNNENTSTESPLEFLLKYIQLKKNVRQLKEATALAKMLDADQTLQEQFEYAQAARDFGWLYYYILRFHIHTMVNIPEISTNVISVNSDFFVPYHEEMIKQQGSE